MEVGFESLATESREVGEGGVAGPADEGSVAAKSAGRLRGGEAVGRVDLGADVLADDVGAVEGREDAVRSKTAVRI